MIVIGNGGSVSNIDWDNIDNKPSVFTPDTHSHTVSDISDFPSLDYLPLAGGTMTGGIDMGGSHLQMGDGNGTDGGNINMEGGDIEMAGGSINNVDLSNVNGIYMADYSWINLSGGNLNIYGGSINFKDGGGIGIQNNGSFDYLSIFGLPLAMNGNNIYMYDGTGTGGGQIYVDGGSIYLSNGYGTGGGTLNLEGGNINMGAYDGTGGGALNMEGGTIKMGDVYNANGSDVVMDGGDITYVKEIYPDTSAVTAPSAGAIGEVANDYDNNVSLTEGNDSEICSITLGAGKWLIIGHGYMSGNAGTINNSSSMFVAFDTGAYAYGRQTSQVVTSGSGSYTSQTMIFTAGFTESTTVRLSAFIETSNASGGFGTGDITAVRIA